MKSILDKNKVKELFELIDESSRIVLTCHVRPDGDAIGSTLGLLHLLVAMNKKVRVVTPDLAPRSLSFLPGFKDLIPYTKYPDFTSRVLNDANLLICCDFNKLSRVDNLAPLLEQTGCRKILIDHHLEPDEFCDLTISRPEMSSTCELVFRLICAMGLYDRVDVKCATCLATGLITDTRNLSVNCSAPELYLIMYELIEKGVDKQRIVKEALNTRTLDAFRLNAFAMCERLTLIPERHTAIITLSADDLKNYNYERGDTEGLVNEPLQIRGINASYFLREDADCIKVSARSNNNFPVNRICEDLFGGGGHLQAAGGEYKDGTLSECKELIINNLSHYAKYTQASDDKDKNK